MEYRLHHNPLLLYGKHLHCYFSWVIRMSLIKQQRLACTGHSTCIFGCASSARKHSREHFFHLISCEIYKHIVEGLCHHL